MFVHSKQSFCSYARFYLRRYVGQEFISLSKQTSVRPGSSQFRQYNVEVDCFSQQSGDVCKIQFQIRYKHFGTKCAVDYFLWKHQGWLDSSVNRLTRIRKIQISHTIFKCEHELDGFLVTTYTMASFMGRKLIKIH